MKQYFECLKTNEKFKRERTNQSNQLVKSDLIISIRLNTCQCSVMMTEIAKKETIDIAGHLVRLFVQETISRARKQMNEQVRGEGKYRVNRWFIEWN